MEMFKRLKPTAFHNYLVFFTWNFKKCNNNSVYCVAHVALENCKQWSTGNNTNNNNINNNNTLLLLLFTMISIISGSSHFKNQVSICVFVK